MRLSDFIEQSNRQDSPEAILGLMERAADDFGFDRYAYCALTSHHRYNAVGSPPPAVAYNFPESWIDYYFEHDYPSKDPVLLYSPELGGPFLWAWLDIAFPLDRTQRAVMQQADEARLRDGVGVPLHGPRGNLHLVTFAASGGHPDPAAEMGNLRALAAQFHAAYSDAGGVENGPAITAILSQRERDCLQWIALGKTSWDVGMILKISEHTVNFHVRNACKKLDTNDRILAVIKAIQYGLISMDSGLLADQ